MVSKQQLIALHTENVLACERILGRELSQAERNWIALTLREFNREGAFTL